LRRWRFKDWKLRSVFVRLNRPATSSGMIQQHVRGWAGLPGLDVIPSLIGAVAMVLFRVLATGDGYVER